MILLEPFGILILFHAASAITSDLAFNKPAWKHPETSETVNNPAYLANDGDSSTCMQTYNYYFNGLRWWLVDLEVLAVSLRVEFRVGNTEPEYIDVFTKDPRSDSDPGTRCPHSESNLYIIATCPEDVSARYVKITHPTSYYGYYSICEAYVYAETVLFKFHNLNTVTAHEPEGHIPALDVGVTPSKIACAMHLTRHDDKDGFRWDSSSKVCHLYNDAESLEENVETGGQDPNLSGLYTRYKPD